MPIKFFFIFLALTIASSVFASEQIDINSASLGDLEKLTSVGPAIGQRIIDERPFSSVNDLMKVKGIGEKTLQKIKDQGLACVDCASKENLNQNQPVQKPIEQPTPKTYPAGIFINEILPAPQGSDETNEFIELYNTSDSSADVSGWKLKDVEGTMKIYAIPKDTTIEAHGFLVVKRLTTHITLNNQEDGVTLTSPDGKIQDSVVYHAAPSNQSYNRNSRNNWQWSRTLTPGAENSIPEAILPKTESRDNNIVDNGPANVSLALEQKEAHPISTNNPLFLFFIVLITTIISAVILFLVKMKFLEKMKMKFLHKQNNI